MTNDKNNIETSFRSFGQLNRQCGCIGFGDYEITRR